MFSLELVLKRSIFPQASHSKNRQLIINETSTSGMACRHHSSSATLPRRGWPMELNYPTVSTWSSSTFATTPQAVAADQEIACFHGSTNAYATRGTVFTRTSGLIASATDHR